MKHTKPVLRMTRPPAFLLALSCLANSALAATFSGPHEVKSFIVGGYGLHVELSPTPSQCVHTWEGTQFVLIRAHADFKSILASILAAHNSDRPVFVWHNAQGDGTCGFSNQLSIDAIQVK